MLVLQEIFGYILIGFIMAAFSFLIEFVQYFTGRSCDIDDLMFNTLGGVLGYGLFVLISKLFGNKEFWKKMAGL